MAKLGALTDRLFFAVFPDVDVATRIARLGEGLRCQHRLRGKALAIERLHVSLHHVGDFARPPDMGVVKAARASRRRAPALMYADGFVADRAVEPVRWTVHEFVLVHSLLGRSRYLALGRFPLD